MNKDELEKLVHNIPNLELTILSLTTLIGFLKCEPHGCPHPLMTIDALTDATKSQYTMYVLACNYWKKDIKTFNSMIEEFESQIPNKVEPQRNH